MRCYLGIALSLFITANALAQKPDSSFIVHYPQKYSVTCFVANDYIELREGTTAYMPNNPLTVGVGFAIQHTIVSVRAGIGLFNFRGKEYGKTKALDLQLHHYGNAFIADLFLQQYKGYFTDEDKLVLHPNTLVRQIGAEGTYIVNHSKFSAKAAFLQSDRQLQSAGSFVASGGLYYYKVLPGIDPVSRKQRSIDNLQLGASTGYAYTWVINQHLLLSGMATAGVNVGAEPSHLGNLSLYPTALGRAAASYNRNSWSVAFLVLIHNKTIPAFRNTNVNLTAVNMQVSFVKRFGHMKK